MNLFSLIFTCSILPYSINQQRIDPNNNINDEKGRPQNTRKNLFCARPTIALTAAATTYVHIGGHSTDPSNSRRFIQPP